jgi:p-hydroxybenzoate 3-monooxygenase
VADARVLADALVRWYSNGDAAPLEGYSQACLPRVWGAQHFASWMTTMLHRMPDDRDGFQARLQRAQLEYICSSRAAATSLAESYVGREHASAELEDQIV